MATQLQLRRGTTAENNLFTGAQGELTMDTDTNGLRIHDGSTAGGFKVDTVVAFQEPTAQNNYTWARKYASGWVEQGGVTAAISPSASVSPTLPVEMSDTNYTALATALVGGKNASVAARATTSISIQLDALSGSTASAISWEVKGMAQG